MNAVFIILFAILPVYSPSDSGANSTAKPVGSVLRRYDLTSVLPQGRAGFSRAMVSTFDNEWLRNNEWPRNTKIPSETFGRRAKAVVIFNFLFEVLKEEFEYEGRRIALSGGDEDSTKLLVYAPPTVHKKVQMVLAGLEKALSSNTEITIDIVSLNAVGEESFPTSALLPVEEVERWLSTSAVRADKRKTYRLQIEPGRTSILDLTRRESFLAGYDVEVATGMAIPDPKIEEVETGTQILVRAVPQPAGLSLALYFKKGELFQGVKTREIPFGHSISLQDEVRNLESAKVFQEVEVFSKSLGWNTFLPEGKALIVSSQFSSDRASSREFLIIRRTGKKLPSVHRFEIEQSQKKVILTNLGNFHPPRIFFFGSLIDGDNISPLLGARFRPYPPHEILDFLGDSPGVQKGMLGSWLFQISDSTSEEDGSARLEAFFPKGSRRNRLIEVSFTLIRGGEEPSVAAKWSVPIQVGEAWGAVIGLEGIAIVDYNVQIAQNSAIPDPIEMPYFDGLVLWVKPSLGISGILTLDVRARAHLRLDSSHVLDLKATNFGKIDQLAFDCLIVDERIVFPDGGVQPRRITLGDSSAKPAEGSLSLQIEVKQLR